MTNSSCCVDLPMGHACLLDGWGRTEDSHCVFEGQEKLWEWMQSSAEVARVEATAQYSLYGSVHRTLPHNVLNCASLTNFLLAGLTGNGRLFFSYGQQGSVPTSDCCKELTVKLISFFFLHVLLVLSNTGGQVQP
jgi:hypothetical protein